MPVENMVHNYGGTKKKSTLVDESIIVYINTILIYIIVSQEKMKGHPGPRF